MSVAIDTNELVRLLVRGRRRRLAEDAGVGEDANEAAGRNLAGPEGFMGLDESTQSCVAAQAVLEEGKSLSNFVEASVHEAIDRRRTRAEFVKRGPASGDEARRTGRYIAADSWSGRSPRARVRR
jgi:hypothetical protein